MKLKIACLASLMLLGACASISKEECLVGAWEQLGFRDATNGYNYASRLGSHMEACAKVGVSINRELYMKGYNDGLKTFCTFDRGLDYGRQGRYYEQICPTPLANDFQRGYNLGQQLNHIDRQIEGLKQEIQGLENQLVKEALAYERRRIMSDISTKRTLIETLQTQESILQSQAGLPSRI